MRVGRRVPALPRARSYGFGVAGDFVDYMDALDDQARDEYHDWRAIRELFWLHKIAKLRRKFWW